ncbi:MAG: recombinase family protein [Alphaproteobacteria bacterium]
MTGQRIAYVRVSTTDQNTERQLEGMTFERTFNDKCSGATTDRPALTEALAYVRQGDTLVVHSLDRLARNLGNLRTIVDTLTKRGVAVEFVKERLTFTGEDSPMANLLLNLLGSVAQFERSLILERQREGIAIAKKKGVYKGRAFKLSDAQAQDLRTRIASGESKAALARAFNISRETLYNYLRA